MQMRACVTLVAKVSQRLCGSRCRMNLCSVQMEETRPSDVTRVGSFVSLGNRTTPSGLQAAVKLMMAVSWCGYCLWLWWRRRKAWREEEWR